MVGISEELKTLWKWMNGRLVEGEQPTAEEGLKKIVLVDMYGQGRTLITQIVNSVLVHHG